MSCRTDPGGFELLFACAGMDRDKIRQLAFQTGFCQRDSGKIAPCDFLVQLCLESAEGTVSHNDLAARVEAHTGASASRQAYWERTNAACVRFFQSVLECVLLSKCGTVDVHSINRNGRFKRILLQDSTIIQLPLRLFEVFRGVKNAHTAVCNARIQGIYDLLSGSFLQFSVDPYSRNDQAASFDIPAQPGDLILRDRGYFCLEAIAQHQRAGSDSINRYKHATTLFDPATGQPIPLLQCLTANGSLDMPVLAGTQEKVPLRLLAVPVDPETANRRRMKAKQEMKGRAPSQELLRLMSWTLFLVTITDPGVTFRDILALYGLRWRIENIFKTWKGNFHFAKVHGVSETQLRVLLNARLILICLTYERLFLPLSLRFHGATGRQLSLMKFMRYFSKNHAIASRFLNAHSLDPQVCAVLKRYCAYEKRKRTNFSLDIAAVLLNIGPLRA